MIYGLEGFFCEERLVFIFLIYLGWLKFMIVWGMIVIIICFIVGVRFLFNFPHDDGLHVFVLFFISTTFFLSFEYHIT